MNTLRRTIQGCGLILIAMTLSHCKTRGTQDSLTLANPDTGIASTQKSNFVHPINEMVGDGDEIFVPIDPKRKITQITPYYSGSYKLPVINEDGSIKKNDEGATYYRDGIYAFGYIRDQNGQWQSVSRAKFIDHDEHDNWHDLHIVPGDVLKIEFKYGDRYRTDQEVLSSNRKVQMHNVKVVYADAEGETFHIENYNPQSEASHEVPIAVATQGIKVESGQSHTVKFDGTGKKIYKVVVRWGDAKPRKADGSWDAGFARGSLSINGKTLGSLRNVAFIENQTWDGFEFTGPITVDVNFRSHFGRVHSVKIYYTE